VIAIVWENVIKSEIFVLNDEEEGEVLWESSKKSRFVEGI
jgi:hypothetical protein